MLSSGVPLSVLNTVLTGLQRFDCAAQLITDWYRLLIGILNDLSGAHVNESHPTLCPLPLEQENDFIFLRDFCFSHLQTVIAET